MKHGDKVRLSAEGLRVIRFRGGKEREVVGEFMGMNGQYVLVRWPHRISNQTLAPRFVELVNSTDNQSSTAGTPEGSR